MRLTGNYSIAERVIGGATVGLVPSGREFVAEAQRHGQLRRQANDILGIQRAKKRPPIHFSWRGIVKKRRRRSLQESLQAGECRLTVLAERDRLVCLKRLEPGATTKL